MQKITTARVYLFSLLAIVTCIVAACTEDSPTTTTPTVGDTARGRYLVQSVAGCGDCHTPRDPATGAPIAGKAFAGGQDFSIPGVATVYSANITPDSATGIGAMTDAQLISAIRTGILTETHGTQTEIDTLVVMPYQLYAHLTDNDVKAIIAYLRTLTPVSNAVTAKTVNLPFTPHFPKQEGFPTSTDTTATKGRYLAIIGGCNDCHTPRDPQTFVSDMTKFFSGGEEFDLGPLGKVYAANITPDSTTGIGKWTHDDIHKVLTQGIDDEGEHICPPMPWQVFKNMTEADLHALITYLKAIPAISNSVPEKTASCN